MRLTSLADYAVVMMAAAARRDPGARLSATLLAEETGIPLPTAQKLTARLAAAREHVRVLIAYGTYWFPWYMRRLAERPANVWFVVKSLVS